MSHESRRARVRRWLAAAGTALVVGAAGAVGVATPAHAAEFEVTEITGGSGDIGSLPWAVDQANAAPDFDTIKFDLPSPSTITIDSANLLNITQPVRITGLGAANLTIDADGTAISITGSIEVEITGLTVRSSTPGAYGIDAVDATVVLDDITANDFTGAGIVVQDGGLTATNIRAKNNGIGIRFSGATPTSQPLSLDGVDASGNIFGIFAEGTDSTVDLRNIVSDDNDGLGIYIDLSGPDAVLTMSDTRTDRSGNIGHYIILHDEARATITRASASDGGQQGLVFDAGFDTQLTIDDATAALNDRMGVVIQTSPGAVVDLLNSAVDANGAGCGCGGKGIALFMDEGDVTIAATDVTNNVGDFGAGIGLENFFGEDARLTIRDSRISSNRASSGGGGLSLYHLGEGEVTGSVTILRTTISGNTAPDGGGVLVDNFSFSDTGALLTIDQSTISGNNTAGAPGVTGGGISIYKDDDHDPGLGVVDILNSTISGNFAAVGSGVYVLGDGANPDSMSTRIRHSTIAANVGGDGVILEGVEQQLVLDHALIANNGATDLDFIDAPELFTMAFSLVEEPGSGVTVPGGFSNQTGVDPRLGPLAGNGGPTFTHNLLEGSPAFNTGDPAFTAPPSVDQRGLPRVFQIIDIGAVERTPLLPATGVASAPLAPVALLMLALGVALVGLRRRNV